MFQQNTVPVPERRILRRAEVEAKTGFKRAHIYNLMKEESFPRRCVLACEPWDGTLPKLISGSLIASKNEPDCSQSPITRSRPCK
ncbi:AlpA family phage regulatory protein [Pectobacterium parmentieri]|uniref:Transcriptional regulator (Phage-like) n=1 Tax=Pectobacterium parmentieri TaxID=1905730 RepID=A0A0H3I6S3_PECPM|nr:putative transcriptional regulator (Phage-like) [Pectobacterium parmentieri]